MAKDLKLKIKNKQLAKAVGLDKLKAKLAGETEETEDKNKPSTPSKPAEPKPEGRRIRAKSRSDFAPPEEGETQELPLEPLATSEENIETTDESHVQTSEPVEEIAEVKELPPSSSTESTISDKEEKEEPRKLETPPAPALKEKLGPTGRHIKDLFQAETEAAKSEKKEKEPEAPKKEKEAEEISKENKEKKVREFKDFKTVKQKSRRFDARDRAGLTESEDERWRKKRAPKQRAIQEEIILRPTQLKVRLPISIKDLASQMKLKASELIAKLLMQGMPLTLNDILDDETIVTLLGQEFGCEITIDTAQEKRLRITDLSIAEEISKSDAEDLTIRAPVVTFMGHVDHGKTSLIDRIRKSNVASSEAGAITQHMGAFKCKTAVGEITILDTPGHEAFSAMRARGAEVTDIVVLVIAGDEGIKDQTLEAIQHALEAEVTIVVAINKCDKPNFNVENVYRELAEHNLLPEAWGGQIITVNTSAVTGEGIEPLLEMLALQAEVLELKAIPNMRARGTVLESELHKGLGSVATVLVQNGTLRLGDPIVFEGLWGRVKTMTDEHGKALSAAGPSTPVEITGLSGLPAAGDPFIVVESEKEARDISEARAIGHRGLLLQKKKMSVDFLQKQTDHKEKKILKVILRADVQGSLEALKESLLKIDSKKAGIEVISTGVGEISESDVQLASISKAVIFGFHTKIESHAEPFIKELGVTIRIFDIIYRAIDEAKLILRGLLEKIEEEKDVGKAEVKAVFKASQLGVIAGCQVIEGTMHRNHRIRVMRGGNMVWKGAIASLKRVKEDVREVKKGLECGILLDGFNDTKVGDILVNYEIVYHTQEL